MDIAKNFHQNNLGSRTYQSFEIEDIRLIYIYLFQALLMFSNQIQKKWLK